MSNTVIIFRRYFEYNALPFLFCSCMAAALYFLPNGNGAALMLSASFLFPLFTVFYSLKSFQKATSAAFCCLLSSLMFYQLSGIPYSLLACALLGIPAVKLFSGVRWQVGFLAMLLSGVALGAALGVIYPYVSPLSEQLASVLNSRGALFGTVNLFYDTAVSERLGQLIYHSSYTGAVFTQGEIKTGVAQLLQGRAVAQLLSGKYFVNIALTSGLLFAVAPRLKGRAQSGFFAVCAVALVCGDVRLLGVFLLLYNPFLYLAYLLSAFVAYLIPSLLDLRVPFEKTASLLELLRFGNRWGYVLAVALVLGLLMYFLSKLVFSRFHMEHGRYVPKNMRFLLGALGGEENLLRFDGDVLLVKNPNLINILKIDCDIHQNAVSLFPDEAALLKEYLESER